MSIAEKLQTIAENEQRVYEAGKTEGIEEGKQAEYDAFWDLYQNKGNVGYLVYLFAGRGWNDITFKPKYDIKPTTGASGIFRQCRITNLRASLLSCGVTLDLSKCTGGIDYAFAYNELLTVLPKLDFSSTSKLTGTCSGSAKLVEVEEMVVHEKLQYSSPFSGCTALEHLIVTGTIGQNGFDVSACPLDHDSLMSIINALKSGVSSLTVTLGSTNLAKLTDAEKAIATQKGWTLL